jgi:hypothetical protein
LKWVLIGVCMVGWIVLQIFYRAAGVPRQQRPGFIQTALGFVGLFLVIYAILVTVQG